MTFSDIFKSSFLKNVTSVSVLDMVLALGLAFAIGLFDLRQSCFQCFFLIHSVTPYRDTSIHPGIRLCNICSLFTPSPAVCARR